MLAAPKSKIKAPVWVLLIYAYATIMTMIITKIKVYKKKVTIYVDKKKIDVDKSVYPNFYLYEGKDLSPKELKEIENANSNVKLLAYAMKLRQKSVISEYKLREKLYNKEASKKDVDYVIKMMKAYDLINDEALANDYLEYYNSLNYGKNKIKSKLSEKGIFEEYINKLKFPASIELKKAKNLLPKFEKKYEKYNSVSKKQHIYNAYIQQGFDIDVAKEMVGQVKDSNPKDELTKLKSDYSKVKTRLSRKYQKKELKQKCIQALLQKGYRLNDIIKVVEGN